MITPILLCGGSGTRLWPLSRQSYPKQFAPLISETSLFQATATRLSGDGFNAPTILTVSDFRFLVEEQLAQVGVKPDAILIEPEGRNTAPAILASALWHARTNPDAVLLVAPSDHAIPDGAAFRAAVSAGLPAAQAGQIVTLGITPTRDETGYGYLELQNADDAKSTGPVPLAGFVEKPNAARAAEMVASGKFLWNAGVFLFSAKTLISAFETYQPAMLSLVQASVDAAEKDLNFYRLAPEPWSKLENISIDYAVMEKAPNMSAVAFGAGWSDLGGWESVWLESGPDEKGVVATGAATALDCENTLLRSEDDGLELVGLGLKNIVAVAMPDAVLVADASRAQEVKTVVETLKAKPAKQATEFPKDHRPWGWFESLAMGDRFQVKRIVVHPGAALSLQSHHHRAEHWIVVQGTALVTIDDEKKLVSENQSIYVPLGAVHRMENPGKVPMVLIEVQTGSYLGEDDIIRYEDVYART